MPVFKLSSKDFDQEYLLIALHTSLEDYRLAYFLNSYLHLYFRKKEDWVDEDKEYSFYQYVDSLGVVWDCIANKQIRHVERKTKYLFYTDEVSYLIKEYKKVDYWLKVECGFPLSDINRLLSKIRVIPKLVTAYNIDFKKLKSKNKLMF